MTARKGQPIWSGVMRYFPRALLAVAEVSVAGNEQHNPGEPLHWSRGKSDDHGDACARHLLDAGKRDTDGQRHSAKAVWRALALLELEIEAEEEAASRNPWSMEVKAVMDGSGNPLTGVGDYDYQVRVAELRRKMG